MKMAAEPAVGWQTFPSLPWDPETREFGGPFAMVLTGSAGSGDAPGPSPVQEAELEKPTGSV